MNYKELYLSNRLYYRINKSKARRLFNEGIDILIYTIHESPLYFWSGKRFINNKDVDFDKIVNKFEYYNCNSEMGLYSKFYVDSEDLKEVIL